MSEMQEFYHVTWEFCRKQMESIKESYGVPSVFALTRAEDIWRSVEKVLYSDGKYLHFRKRGDLPEIRAKQASRAIVIKSSDSGLVFKYRDLNIHCKIKGHWQNRMQSLRIKKIRIFVMRMQYPPWIRG